MSAKNARGMEPIKSDSITHRAMVIVGYQTDFCLHRSSQIPRGIKS